MAAEGGRSHPAAATVTSANGAATVWPRKGALEAKHFQWRARQWGRDRLAAEGSITDWKDGIKAGRQWGRDRLAAEGRRRRRQAHTHTRVNGAATVWPRKVVHIVRAPLCSCLRQWGRDRLAAEGLGLHPMLFARCSVNGAATVWPRKEGP